MSLSPSASAQAAFGISRIAAPVRSQIEQQLRQAITSGHFRPGDRLIERELCVLLGVSRTSLREALRQLESDGLVTNIPHKGLVVATITRAEAQEVYQLRAVVEGLAGRLFAQQAEPALRTQLARAMNTVEDAFKKRDMEALIAAKGQFYQILLTECGNRPAGIVLQSLHDRIAHLRVLTLAQPGRAAQSVAEMHRILEAILAGEPEQACRACMDHVEQAARVATAVLEQQRP
ncbi:MAG TPA: GntR family transcriptional regulator [Ktedonobacteraceae bacterium]|nr:GntR family transcriptional regulator [Ktedonobacteraceae bacterium]